MPTAEDILRDRHFEVFNAMEAIGNRHKRAFQKYLKGLRMIEHAVLHLTGREFSGFPLNCGLTR
jgi:hypothetical protein